LIDAPCTGEGTVRKDPQALANWSEKRILLAAKLQKKLMTAAFEALAVGGELVYSTCTLAPEENEKVVEYLLQKFPGLAQVVDLSSSFVGAKQAIALGDQGSKMLRLWPQVFDSEGFFVAKIRKAKSTNFNAQQNRSSLKKFNWSQKSKLKPISKKDQQRLADFLALEFGFDLSLFQGRILTQADHKRQIKVGVKVFIVPEDFESKGQKFDRAGILLGEIYRHDLRLDHELAVCVGHLFTKRIIELTREDLLIYYQGLDLAKSNYRELQDLNSGQLAVKYEGQVVGLVKIIGSRLKNLLPRKFVQEII
jgi:16S rRNA (cytosine1407-C5)-methyltransferase